MADQNISFKVTVNSKEAEDSFRRLADKMGATVTQSTNLNKVGVNSNMMLQSTSRIIQDMPYGFMAVGNNITFLAEQMSYASSQGVKFGAQLKGMLQSLAGSGGVVFAISLVTSAITHFTMRSGQAKDGVDKLNDSVKTLKGSFDSLLKIENPFERLFFPLKSGEIQNVLDNVKNQLTNTQQNISLIIQNFIRSKPVGQVWTTDPETIIGMMRKSQDESVRLEAKRIEQLQKEETARKGLLTTLEDQKLKVESLEMAYGALSDAGLKATEKTKEQTRAVQEHAKSIGFLSVLYGDLIDSLDRVSKSRGGGLQFAGQVPTPDKPIPNVFVSEAELKEYDAFLFTTMTATAQSVGNLFKGMWREIFGEANNLLTDFIGNIISSLADVAARGLAIDLLNLAFPGAGLIGGLGLFNSKQPAGGSASAVGQLQKSTNVYNINIGQQTVAQVVTEGYNTAVRLRKL